MLILRPSAPLGSLLGFLAPLTRAVVTLAAAAAAAPYVNYQRVRWTRQSLKLERQPCLKQRSADVFNWHECLGLSVCTWKCCQLFLLHGDSHSLLARSWCSKMQQSLIRISESVYLQKYHQWHMNIHNLFPILYKDTFDLFTVHLVAFLLLKPQEVLLPEVSSGSPTHHLLYLLHFFASFCSRVHQGLHL